LLEPLSRSGQAWALLRLTVATRLLVAGEVRSLGGGGAAAAFTDVLKCARWYRAGRVPGGCSCE
jgi:hypothetical protein